jgi:predicted nucleotidyltransferase
MRQDIERRIAAFFASNERAVAAVYLFGSTARDEARPDSDVDVAVLFDTAPAATLNGPRFSLEGELERALGSRVDIVTLNDAPVDLRIRILREGRLLVDRRPSVRIAFEVRTRNEAFDLEPILIRYRAARKAAP